MSREKENPADEMGKVRINTTARLGVGRAGHRPRTETLLDFRDDHGTARDAVLTKVDETLIADREFAKIETLVANKEEYLARPDRAREISEETTVRLREECEHDPQVQLIVSDGLSSTAVEKNVPELLPILFDGLEAHGLGVGTLVFVEYGRVDVMDAIGEDLGASCCVNLIGERPGLATAESLSAYLVYDPKRGTPTSKKSVISNIHSSGLAPVEAGAEIAALVSEMCEKRASGISLREDDREFQA